MSVWNDMLLLNKNKSPEYLEGLIEGAKYATTMYAVWKDGKQYVGIMQEPLEVVLAEIDDSKGA